MRPAKILIRLCECAGWSESSLWEHFRKHVLWRYVSDVPAVGRILPKRNRFAFVNVISIHVCFILQCHQFKCTTERKYRRINVQTNLDQIDTCLPDICLQNHSFMTWYFHILIDFSAIWIIVVVVVVAVVIIIIIIIVIIMPVRMNQKVSCRENMYYICGFKIQSTLVISNSKELSEIFRDIRTSTYQICRIEEKLIRLTTLNKYIYIIEVRDILKYCEKEEKLLLRSNFSSFPQYVLYVVRVSCLGRDQIFTSRWAVIRDKRVRDSESQL